MAADISDEMSDSDEDQETKLRPSGTGAISVPLGWPKVTVVYCAQMVMCVKIQACPILI